MDDINFKWYEDLGISIGSIFAFFSNYKQLMANFVPGKNTIKGEFFYNSLPQGKEAKIYEGNIYLRKKIFWLIPVNITISKESIKTKNTMIAIDGAPGSTFILDDKVLGESSKIKEGFKKKDFCFVPTVSALAITDWEKYINTNFSTLDLYAEELSEFEEIQADGTNKLSSDLASGAIFLAKHMAAPEFRFEDTSSLVVRGSTPIKLINKIPLLAVSWSATAGFKAGSINSTSGQIAGFEKDKKGIVTASITVPVSGEIADLLGTNSVKVQTRKRVESYFDVSINGGILSKEGRAKYYLNAYTPGMKINWSLSNTNDFKIVSSAADSVIIQAKGYNEKTTLNASFTADKERKLTKELTSPQFEISGEGVISGERKGQFNNNEFEIQVNARENYEYIKWTIPKNFEVIDNITNTPKIKITGVTNSESLSINAETKVNGKVYYAYLSAAVRIPESIKIVTVDRWMEDGYVKELVRADVTPYIKGVGTFIWSGTWCSIETTGSILNSGLVRPPTTVGPPATVGPPTIALGSPGYGTSPASITMDNISPELYELLTANRDKENTELNLAAVVINDEEITSFTIGVREREPAIESMNESGEGEIEYISFSTSAASASPSSDIPSFRHIPQDPNYAVVTLSANRDATVKCNYTSSSGVLSSSYPIPYSMQVYSSAYNPGENIIEVIRNNQEETVQMELPQASYKASVYNNFGIVKEVTFSSQEEKVFIPMHGSVSGNYYINVTDENGKVVVSQAVPVK